MIKSRSSRPASAISNVAASNAAFYGAKQVASGTPADLLGLNQGFQDYDCDDERKSYQGRLKKQAKRDLKSSSSLYLLGAAFGKTLPWYLQERDKILLLS